MSIEEKQFWAYIPRTILYFIWTIVFISGPYLKVIAQSSENKRSPKLIDKSKLVIHENLRDNEPQHFNNRRNVVMNLVRHTSTKAAYRSKLRISNRSANKAKPPLKATKSTHKELKAKRIRHTRTNKHIRHN
jgi:hypothetical protein